MFDLCAGGKPAGFERLNDRLDLMLIDRGPVKWDEFALRGHGILSEQLAVSSERRIVSCELLAVSSEQSPLTVSRSLIFSVHR